MRGSNTLTLAERFMNKVEPEPNSGCWLWVGTSAGVGERRDQILSGSYGMAYVSRQRPKVFAHRLAWELFRGPIPEGFTVDHLCRVRRCVNPAHLEPVSLRDNILRGTAVSAIAARKTHCPRGHPYDFRYWNGGRGCSRCRREQNRNLMRRKRGSVRYRVFP